MHAGEPAPICRWVRAREHEEAVASEQLPAYLRVSENSVVEGTSEQCVCEY